MSGATVAKLHPAKEAANKKAMASPKVRVEVVWITPELATKMLDHNKLNRPLRQVHVNRIARLITGDRWKFNGDTVKIAYTGDVLDGQHRLWAIILANTAVQTIVVYGIDPDAFSTIDTVRQLRSGADVLALHLGKDSKYRTQLATAYSWLLRWQRGVLPGYRDPGNKIENDEIEQALAAHPGLSNAVERTMKLRTLVTPAILAFMYYVLTNRDQELAERMVNTLEDPAGVAVNDPFFRLRVFLTGVQKRKDPLVVIALAIKAANAAKRGEKVQVLSWRNQGRTPEAFPTLEV
jgi:hypothetical protein